MNGITFVLKKHWTPLLSSSQEFLATYPQVRVRLPALPDSLRSSGFRNGIHSASWVQLRSLEEKVVASVKKNREYRSWPNFANQRRSLGRYSSLADTGLFCCSLQNHLYVEVRLWNKCNWSGNWTYFITVTALSHVVFEVLISVVMKGAVIHHMMLCSPADVSWGFRVISTPPTWGSKTSVKLCLHW
jgi:hypothetical protein